MTFGNHPGHISTQQKNPLWVKLPGMRKHGNLPQETGKLHHDNVGYTEILKLMKTLYKDELSSFILFSTAGRTGIQSLSLCY
jgi:hypothetical protein